MSRNSIRSITIAFLLTAVAPQSNFANPSGGVVKHGDVQFSLEGSTFTIDQFSNRAIIDWGEFSIGPGELTRFIQPSLNSAVLNRVVSATPSSILGTLQANGQIILINPNGVLIGPSGRIDAGGGFIASALDLADSQFLAGGDLTFSGTSMAALTNLGTIVATNGSVVLISGGNVTNAGAIEAQNGVAGLASGTRVLVKSSGDERIFVETGSANGKVDQSGTIRAAQAELKAVGGNAESLAVNMSGVVEATGVQRVGGRILLTAGGGKASVSGTMSARSADGAGGEIRISGGLVDVSPTATLDASGSSGGLIAVDSTSATNISGRLVARGDSGSGGRIEVTGETVNLHDSASLDASGDALGGEVFVGGGVQGSDPELRNSETTTVASGASVLADSSNLDAGVVVVWADGSNTFEGLASASALGETGNGGFVEISGKQELFYSGSAQASSFAGVPGWILFDPFDSNTQPNAPAPNDGALLNPSSGGLVNGVDINDGLGQTYTFSAQGIRDALAASNLFILSEFSNDFAGLGPVFNTNSNNTFNVESTFTFGQILFNATGSFEHGGDLNLKSDFVQGNDLNVGGTVTIDANQVIGFNQIIADSVVINGNASGGISNIIANIITNNNTNPNFQIGSGNAGGGNMGEGNVGGGGNVAANVGINAGVVDNNFLPPITSDLEVIADALNLVDQDEVVVPEVLANANDLTGEFQQEQNAINDSVAAGGAAQKGSLPNNGEPAEFAIGLDGSFISKDDADSIARPAGDPFEAKIERLKRLIDETSDEEELKDLRRSLDTTKFAQKADALRRKAEIESFLRGGDDSVETEEVEEEFIPKPSTGIVRFDEPSKPVEITPFQRDFREFVGEIVLLDESGEKVNVRELNAGVSELLGEDEDTLLIRTKEGTLKALRGETARIEREREELLDKLRVLEGSIKVREILVMLQVGAGVLEDDRIADDSPFKFDTFLRADNSHVESIANLIQFGGLFGIEPSDSREENEEKAREILENNEDVRNLLVLLTQLDNLKRHEAEVESTFARVSELTELNRSGGDEPGDNFVDGQ